MKSLKVVALTGLSSLMVGVANVADTINGLVIAQLIQLRNQDIIIEDRKDLN